MNLLGGKKVKKSLSLSDGGSVVLVDMMGVPKTTPHDEVNRNIFCVDEKGNVRWQVETVAEPAERVPYTNIYFDEKGGLFAYCWDGGEYAIDVDNGKVKIGDLLK